MNKSIFQWSIACSTIILLIDYYDLPSNILTYIWFDKVLVIMAVISICVIQMSKYKASDYKVVIGEGRLKNAINIVLSSVIIAILFTIVIDYKIYKIIIYSIVLVVAFSINKIWLNDKITYKKNIEDDLKSIYSNKMMTHTGQPVVLSGKDVSYDLLDRWFVINELSQAIKCGFRNYGYVVSLEGEWGSGKTTVLNNVREKFSTESKNVKFVQSFDPWLYSYEKALINGLLESILQGCGINYNGAYYKNILNGLIDVTLDGTKSNNLVKSLFKRDEYKVMMQLKERISKYLSETGKCVVVIIDNLDRAESNNIIYLVKVISIVFDIKGLVFVLSFERDRIDSVLNSGETIDSRFIEKIINHEIRMPKNNDERMSGVIRTCTTNLIHHYDSSININDYQLIIELIIQKVSNLRSLKRLYNSVFFKSIVREYELCRQELLTLEVIRFLNSDLYDFLFKYHEVLATYGDIKDFDSLEKNNEIENALKYVKCCIDNEYADYTKIITSLFPIMNQLNNHVGQNILLNLDEEFSQKVSAEMRVCHKRFSSRYFTFSSSDIEHNIITVENIISIVNKVKSQDEMDKIIKNFITRYSPKEQTNMVDIVELKSNLISDDVILKFNSSIYNNIHYIDDKSSFLGLSARDKMCAITAKLLTRINETEFKAFVDMSIKDYDKLFTISNMIYWLGLEQNTIDSVEMFKKSHYKVCEEIINEKINLYDNDYYHENNVYGVIKFADIENIGLEDYFRSTVNKDNVIRFLWDITSKSVSDNYKYKVNKEYLDKYVKVEEIEKLLCQRESNTKDEQIVNDIFKKYVNNKEQYKNVFDDMCSLKFKEQLKLKL